MYNEQLEQLIDAALADGELTEKEKQILFKKAQAMGVDLDEFEMVLDARLVKLKKAEAEKAASSAPKSNKLGDVKKCPACGAMVQSYQGVCPECGYAFEGVDANLSSKKLAEAILKMEEKRDYSQVKALIEHFPIPNTKSDMIEFITSLSSKKEGDYYYSVYKTKLDECIIRAKLLFPNDPLLQPLINSIEEKLNTKKKKLVQQRNILIISMVICIIILCCLLFLIWGITDWNKIVKYLASIIPIAICSIPIIKLTEINDKIKDLY
ncbi:MAG: hypothetical protein J5701_01265 [Bacteroidales bacterium]|nr:hypothetical protein [Bacteroidales bacterium]